jgi:predicted DNA-binding protein
MQKKEATSVRLTPEAKTLLQRLSDSLGLSQAGVLEILIRDKAKRERVETNDRTREMAGMAS